MSNHTASVIFVTVILGLSLITNTHSAPSIPDVHPDTYQTPAGTGHISTNDTDTPTSTSADVKVADKHLNSTIATNLAKVYTIAKEMGHPETMQAILLQETNGGTSSLVGGKGQPMKNRSYGLMQVQIIAARSILARYPHIVQLYFPSKGTKSISDKEIVSLLLNNDEANIKIAVQHFDLYLKLSKGNWAKAVAAYNMGIGNANKVSSYDTNPYVRAIKNRIKTTVKPFNVRQANMLTL